jgi:hypothetical protein
VVRNCRTCAHRHVKSQQDDAYYFQSQETTPHFELKEALEKDHPTVVNDYHGLNEVPDQEKG